jgi:lipoate-protein ligase A
VGSVLAARFVSSEDLYNYDELRQLEVATVLVAAVERATLVLGGNQSEEVVDLSRDPSMRLRRRRGGGGLVLLRPEDLWIDWWIPRSDRRWSHDVRVSSIRIGDWWAEALRAHTQGGVRVHQGALEGAIDFRVVCFAGRGPGEVFVNGRKTVGLTQWRVREGVFVSTVLHAGPTTDVLEYLREAPEGLDLALDHQTLASLSLGDRDRFLAELLDVSGDWDLQHILLT